MIAPQFRPIVGGYERAAERLSKALVVRGNTVTVIAERRDPSWPPSEVVDGFEVRRLWCRYRPHLHIATTLASFSWFLVSRGWRFDVWHAHQYGLHATLGILFGRLLGRPVVLKLTNSGEDGIDKTIGHTRGSSLVAALLRQAGGVVALTRETRQEAIEFGISEERVHTIGNGVDPSAFHVRDANERAILRVKLGLSATGVVICAGRMVQAKNPEGVLRAWSEVVGDLPRGWTLVFVGDGPLSGVIADRVRALRLGDSVVLAGQRDDMAEWYGASDLYVSGSNHEGLSNTLLEAMATGLPAVVTRVSGVRELVQEQDAGLVVDVGDTAGLGTAIARLVNDPVLRVRLGTRARQVVEKGYSVDAVARRHEALYRDLIRNGRVTR